MNNQSWLKRLVQRKPEQQNAPQPGTPVPSASLPAQRAEGADATATETSVQRTLLDHHASPAAALSPTGEDQAAVPAIWHVGDVILDQYEVTGKLGEGGMGTVYKVHHRGWNVDLAVKSPRPDIFARAGGKKNFVREAETWVNLDLHPHIVGCYYVRSLGGIPRIFAEYIAGGSLADWMRSRRLYEGDQQQTLARLLDIAIQFAWGLHAAHEHGLIHQDIKPANVMLSQEGIAKVTDFGLAKIRAMTGEEGSEESNSQQSILVSSRGMTPAYCSPEQAMGKALSRKTDIWSWGVSILEMFVGEVTWQGGVLAREALASHEPQDTAIPRMPTAMVKLLARCFEPQPEDRPVTMLEVSQSVQEIYAQEIGQPYSHTLPLSAEMQASNLNNRALSLYDLGKVEEAKQAWEQALQIDPQHLETTYNRGVVLWRQGEMTDDKLVYQLEAIRATPGQPALATLLLAQVHLAGRWLASGSADQTVRLWEVNTGRCVRIFEGHAGGVLSVSLSADGRWLASGCQDNTIQMWELDWELEAYDAVDWDEGARPALEIFLTQHTPYAGVLPEERNPTEQESQQALTRQGAPVWNEEDFQELIHQLQYIGYGWLRPEGVRKQLERLAKEWQGPSPLPGEK